MTVLASRPRIAFLDQYGSLGGGQQVLCALVREAVGLGAEVAAFIPAQGGLAAQLAGLGAKVEPIAEPTLAPGRKNAADLARLLAHSLRVLGRHAPTLVRQDLVYVNGPRLVPAGMALAALGRRVCAHAHLAHAGPQARLLALALRLPRFTGLHVCSPYVRKHLAGLDPVLAGPKVRLVENGLLAGYGGLPFEDRFSGRPLAHVAVIGRLSPEKGQHALAEAAAALPELTFHFLGDALYADQAYAEALRRLMPANARFHGWMDDVPAKVREIGAQVCVVPSTWKEPFGLAALEGMALSCVTLVRGVGGLSDIASATGALAFAEDGDILPLLRGLAASPPADLAGLAHAQHNAVMARYGHQAFASRLRQALAEALAS